MSGALRQFSARKRGFSPDDLADLALWLDASDSSTITETSGSVSQWDDKSGNANHAVQGTSALQPTTGVKTQNGLNTISHPEHDDFLVAPYPTNTAGQTWFVVWAANSYGYNILVSTSSASEYIGAAQDGGTSTLVNNPAADLRIDGTTFTGDRDALHTLTSGQATILTAENVTLNETSYRTAYGDFTTGIVNPQGSGLAEVIVYDAALSPADVADVESYLSDKWGITL